MICVSERRSLQSEGLLKSHRTNAAEFIHLLWAFILKLRRRTLIESSEPVLWNLKAAAIVKRLIPAVARYGLLFGVAMGFAPQAMSAQSDESESPTGNKTCNKPRSKSSDSATCASCHKEVVRDFANNPHSRSARIPGSKGFTCESCHGPGKAHEESGDVCFDFSIPLQPTGQKQWMKKMSGVPWQASTQIMSAHPTARAM